MRLKGFRAVAISVLCCMLILSITACAGGSGDGPTSPEQRATPVATPAASPAPTAAPTPSPTATPTATPAPTPTPTPTPVPTPTPTATPKPTPVPTPTASPTQTPTPSPTPTPTARDIAAAHLSEIIPWFENPPAAALDVAELLVHLWVRNRDLGNVVVGLPWVTDGVDRQEAEVLYRLRDIAVTDLALGKQIVNYPWFAVSVTSREREALYYLGNIASKDIEVARMVASLPWLAADVTRNESEDLLILDSIASRDIELARVAVSPLGSVADVTDGRQGNPRSYLIRSLGDLAYYQGADVVGQLTAQPWFADGLNREEVAFVTALSSVVLSSETLYHDLLQAHFTQTRTVSLRLAGDVNIWVFQNTPFPPGEDLLTVIQDTARISEELLGVPFPTTDIILLVVDHSDKRYRIYSGHFGTNMRLNRSSHGKVSSVPHETVHYYFFNPITGPRWLTEGGANFIATYVNHRTGVEEFTYARGSLLWLFQMCVDRGQQMENIRHLTVVMAHTWEIILPGGCVYQMGEHFLYKASMVMGEEALMSALGELHLLELGRGHHTVGGRMYVEKRIYEVLLKHAPVDRQEDFRDLYRELHGGAAAFPDTDLSDDHGDEAIAATDVGVRQVVHGTLDYMFDFDYFRFRAQEGQRYRVNVNHETLRATSVGLYAPDGLTGENRRWKSRDLATTGPRIFWTAPSSEEYYLAVHNFGGKVGAYTLTITPVDRSVLDDHGDTTVTATEMLVGETVSGTLNDDLDVDYFGFQLEPGQKLGEGGYVLEFVSGILKEFRFRILWPDGGSWRHTVSAYSGQVWSWPPPGFQWVAKSSVEFFVAIDSLDGSVGAYTLKLTLVGNEPGD